jgi:hypothetical protein
MKYQKEKEHRIVMKDNRVIWIPKRFHEEIEKFEGKQIRITIDDEI